MNYDNSPAFQGWVSRGLKMKNPGGTKENLVTVRDDLSSLTGLGWLVARLTQR